MAASVKSSPGLPLCSFNISLGRHYFNFESSHHPNLLNTFRGRIKLIILSLAETILLDC